MQNENAEQSLSDNLARCSRCGLCLKACPTFASTGLETESPRGRVQLMLAVNEGILAEDMVTQYLDSCLQCRACESPCPTGVKVVEGLEDFYSSRRLKFERLLTPWKARTIYLWRKAKTSSKRLLDFARNSS